MSRPQITLGVALFSCGLLIIGAFAADPQKPSRTEAIPADQAEPTPVDEAELALVPESVVEEDLGPWEVTDRVELVFRDQLAVAGDKTLSARVLFKNKSETEIPGKLVLVVDGSSIEGTTLHAPQGQFTETTPYLQMLPVKRVLDAGKETPVKSLILTTAESTAEMKLDSAKLRWRAFTLTKPADLDDNEPPADEKQVPGKGYTWGEMRRVMGIQSQATIALIEKHNGAILGTGTSEDADGKLVIRVYAAQGGMSRKLPGSIGGVPVELTVTGTINGGPALSRVTINQGRAELPLSPTPDTSVKPDISAGPAAPAAPAESAAPAGPAGPTTTSALPSAGAATPRAAQVGPPTRRFTRPVPIGVSALNQTDVCASGTLGCRCVGRDGRLFILSNNHVFAEQNGGAVGDAICQPSRGDIGCLTIPADVIATLYDFQPMQFFTPITAVSTAPVNTMDAAVALTPVGMVDVMTPIEAYGTPARSPQENLFVGMGVQKQGRTSGFTRGRVFSINVEVAVRYTPGFARFRNCIDIQTQFRTPSFGAPGDSGSLVVTLADRRPVGILFAGGGFDTFLNPISPVLHRFKVGIDDGTGAAPLLGSGRMGAATGPVKQHKNEVIPLSNSRIAN